MRGASGIHELALDESRLMIIDEARDMHGDRWHMVLQLAIQLAKRDRFIEWHLCASLQFCWAP
jgi:hypothetical protein